MGSIGESLRAAREAKGLSLQQAEEDTKIRKRYLEALEDEDYDIIPGRVYAKGFLRNYAMYLGLNPDEILMEFKLLGLPAKEDFQKSSIETTISNKRSSSRRERRGYLVTAIIALLAIITLMAYSFIFREAPKDNVTKTDKPVVNEQTYKPDDDTANRPDNNAPQPTDTAGQVYSNQGASGTGTPAPGVPGAGTQVPGSGQTGQNPATVNITLNGKNEVCWASVKVDGVVRFTGNINPGESKSFSGGKVTITLGNAGAVEVIKDGQNLGALGAINQVVRNREFVPGPVLGGITPAQTGTQP